MSITKEMFSIWPNPVHDLLFINIVTRNESQATLKLFDNNGSLIKIQRRAVFQGQNQLSIDIRSLAKGIYSLVADWNNERMRKSIHVVKQ